jgi:hypothetical protein
MALSHLGDRATLQTLSPPDGSAQAQHCAQFYPIARKAVLQSHNWNFATKRAPLALLTQAPPSTWRYAYAAPSDMVKALTVYSPEAWDDVAVRGVESAREYIIETGDDGKPVILTNQTDAVLQYVADVTDTTRYPIHVTVAISHYLASLLAGPVVKGREAGAVSAQQLQLMQAALALAKQDDVNQRKVVIEARSPWLHGRGSAYRRGRFDGLR